MKIIGNTVGTPLPKPDLMQNDPTKGDFVNGREEFAKQFGAATWDELEGKPFYKVDSTNVIAWDGNEENAESFTIRKSGSSATFHKISDIVPDKSELVGARYTAVFDGFTNDVTIAAVDMEDGTNCYIMLNINLLVVTDVDVVDAYGRSGTAPGKGIYAEKLSNPYDSLRIEIDGTAEKILPDRLPDGGFGWEEGGQTVIAWDGGMENRDIVTVAGLPLVKVSGNVPEPSDLAGGSMTWVNPDGAVASFPITEEGLVIEDGYFGASADLPVFVFQQLDVSISGSSYSLPSTGIYMVNVGGAEAGVTQILTYGSSTVHQIDEKFIPDSVARKADTLPMPPSATVGQFIVVSAVDESGKVTATEAITFADAEGVGF